jgi:ankyrin repeat protein
MTTLSTTELTAIKQTLKRYRDRLHRLEAEQEEFLNRIEKLAEGGGKRASKQSPPRHDASADQLMHAIESRDLPKIRRLLKVGVNPNALDRESHPAIVFAAHCTQPLQIIRTLIRAGADVNATDDRGNSALVVLSRDEDIDCVKELVKHGANINAKNQDGDTPLTNAAIWGAIKVVRFLLASSADRGLPDGAGITAINLARQHGHKRIVDLLS